MGVMWVMAGWMVRGGECEVMLGVVMEVLLVELVVVMLVVLVLRHQWLYHRV